MGRNVNRSFSASTDTELSRAQFQMYLNEKNQLSGGDYAPSEAAKLAALGAASARDGALVDLKDLNQHLSARRLLSDADYELESSNEMKSVSGKNAAKSGKNNTSPNLEKKFNLTKKSNESMELVLINGTWHLIDLNVCYNMLRAEAENTNQYYHNNTHLNKYIAPFFHKILGKNVLASLCMQRLLWI